MAIDHKYGQVTTEHGDIGADEPVVVFRGRDILLLKLLQDYQQLCVAAGSPAFHLAQIDAAREFVGGWQERNPDQVRVPSSSGYQDRMTNCEGC